tara:strand:- start:45 stop:770 length:726 start_codon:yes stop_codon:yes gene_type:complete
MLNNIKKNCLSIIIPILNENKNLINLTENIFKNNKGIKFEIIFVDDNSRDGSYQTLENLKKKHKNLRYYIRKKNRDLSQSCFLGIKKSKYKNILIMDGDGQHNPKYINKMFNIFISKNADFVIGARKFEDINESLSFFRFLASKILIFLFKILFKLKTSDPMTGFFLFKKNFYLKNKKYFFGKGYKILADLLYSTPHKIKVIDLKIKFLKRKNEKSKMSLKILLILILFILSRYFKKYKFF